MITKNEVLTYVYTKLIAKYPSLFVTSERTYAVAKFPCLEMRQILATPVKENINLSDNSYRLTFECQAYSNKQAGAGEEVYNIIKECEKAFNEIGFHMTLCEPTENTKEITVKRHLARFVRVCCSDDSLPEEETPNETPIEEPEEPPTEEPEQGE